MSEATPREVRSPLGPQEDALSAYRHATAVAHPLLSQQESDKLGAAIYEGRLSSERLAADPELAVDDPSQKANVEAGLQARRVMASHHLRLVVGISSRWASNAGDKIDKDREAELIGIGNLALW